MNKKLVAVAIAGLLAAPLAQAQTANVTLYGRVNLDMEVVSGGGSAPNIYRVSSNSSRFGVKGSENLGGGLTAIFQIENSVGADASGGTIAARETFVGFQGAWGTVKLGNFLSPYDDLTSIFASVPTLNTGIQAAQALWGQATQTNANGGFDNRNPNSLRYDSPVMGGFNGSMQYSSQEGTPRGNSGIWTLAGFYNNGPASLGVGFTQNNSIRGIGLTDQAFSVAGGWQFTGFKLVGVWERLDYDATTSSNLKRDFWHVGATINIGPGQMYASWGSAGEGKGSAATGTKIGQIVKGDDTGADMWTISYTFPLSKRTLLYTTFVQVRNDDKATYTHNAGITPTAGNNPSGFSMGAVHFF